MLPSQNRLKHSGRIRYIYRTGKAVHTTWFVLNWVANRDDQKRVAFVASKKVGNAVMRNRSARILREAMRGFMPKMTVAADVVIVAKRPILTLKLSEVQLRLEQALRNSGLVE